MNAYKKGILASISSAFLLGLTPIFGKQSILLGFSPLAVVAIRSTIAALLLLLFLLIFKKSFFYIYPLGLLGCVIAGFINGVGSILYYTALSRLDASVGQLLYSFYPLFVALWLVVDRQSVSRITILRLLLILPGVFLLISNSQKGIDLVGAGLMVGASLLYALHLIINQRVLYDVPAPTVTLYTLISMALTVSLAFALFTPRFPVAGTSWLPLLALAVITFAARLTLFLGVKNIGGLRTSILGLGELLVTIFIAQIWLGDRLSVNQWIGAFLISLNLFIATFDKPVPQKRQAKGFLRWLDPPSVHPTDFPFQDQ
ncbi:MAG: DMT family transporter [Anaerolineaceae bacterium]